MSFPVITTLLVVDDNIELLDLLSAGLSDYFRVITAKDGIEGLECSIAEMPDCIIIDVKMPGLDGFQLVRALRGDPLTAHIPLIILTALPEEQGRFVGLASGADQYLMKPVLPSELIPAIDTAVALSHPERAHRWQQMADDTQEE